MGHKRFLRQTPRGGIIARSELLSKLTLLAAGACCLLLLTASGLSQRLSNTTLDLLFTLRGPLPPPQSVVIIGVDEESLEALGSWPFPRKLHAELLTHLSQATVVGFDILFAEPTPDDAAFSSQLSQNPPVVLSVAGSNSGTTLVPAPNITGYAALGSIETLFDGDGLVRKVQLNSPKQYLPFSVALAQTAGYGDLFSSSDQPLINYYGPERTFLYLSYAEVLQGSYPPEFFKHRMVLVGAEAIGLRDTYITPFTRTQVTPGVEIQATILANLLEQTLLHEFRPVFWLMLAALIILGLFIWPRLSERFNVLINIVFLGSAAGAAVVGFHYNLYLETATLSTLLVLTYLFHLLQQTLWTAQRLYTQINTLNARLDKGLSAISNYLPESEQLQEVKAGLLHRLGIQQYIHHLHAAIDALGLQHNFLDNLLKKELPPLALWDATSGSCIFVNVHFHTLWQQLEPHATAGSKPPGYQPFLRALNHKLTTTEGHLENLIDHAANDDHYPLELEIQTLSLAGRKHFQVTIHRFETEAPAFTGIIAILQDVTQLRELERVKDEVVSIVSHELKLPLTTILGYGEILADSLDHEQKEYAEAICTQSQRLKTLIETFLDINRIESGRQQLEALPFQPLTLLNDALNSVIPMAERKNIRLTTRLPSKTTHLVGDELMLLQAVINLLDNAVKFSPQQSEILVSMVEEQETLTIHIADRGPGISPRDRQAIFKKFNRGKGHAAVEGFGLGLNLVQQVADKHNGHIQVAPNPGGGSIFSLILPK